MEERRGPDTTLASDILVKAMDNDVIMLGVVLFSPIGHNKRDVGRLPRCDQQGTFIEDALNVTPQWRIMTV